ncbi:MAG: TetR/AcrR family transcriptional regulator [Rhizomicrobium sp.]
MRCAHTARVAYNDRYLEETMGHPAGKKEETRARILAGAGRAFRSHGYGASGVDRLAQAAGVTSGAFYAHFSSKADAFREAVVAGLQDLESGIRAVRADAHAKWVGRFVAFYLSERRTCDPSESCALQSLTGDVSRADDETRDSYEAELRSVIDAVAEGLDAPSRAARRRESIVLLALLAGGVSLARAVRDPALAEEIAAAVRVASGRIRGKA